MEISWPESNDCVALAADEVHVWGVPLEVAPARLAEMTGVLTDDERQRSGRFMREEVRRRFVVARATLRSVLGRYLAMPPAEVPIAIGRHGKPYLAEVADAGGLKFNLAHSGELALVAITRGCEVGVDVEQLRPIEQWQEIAARYFHPAEVAAIEATSSSERNTAFLRCWTRKEAILKAFGTGLGHSLQTFTVPVGAFDGQWVELATSATGASRRYWLESVAPAPSYVAAVAASLQRKVAWGIVEANKAPR
jgi:4'-phosphopantetheinyl transferase